MSWFDRFRRKAGPLSIRDPLHWRNREGLVSGEAVTADGVMALSAAWACVNLLAGTIASLPLMVYSTRNGVREIAKDHPLYRVLHDTPNRLQTALDFWEFTCASIELRGNSYARVLRNGDRVVSLVPVSPELPVITPLPNGELEYVWSEGESHFRETSATMLHIRGFGGGPVAGLSTLAFGRRVFGLATAINTAASGTFANGLRPSGTLSFKDFLTKDQREIVETRLVDKFAGAMNAGRPMVLEGGTAWQQLTINPEDAQMLESRAFSVEEICRFFGVPPHMVGHTQTSTSWGTGLEQQTLGFQKFALRRRLKRIEQALEKQLLTPEDRSRGVVIEFALEGLLRGDSGARSGFYASALSNGWMTINEVRELENLSPVDGGDVPRMQSQNVPITSAAGQELIGQPP